MYKMYTLAEQENVMILREQRNTMIETIFTYKEQCELQTW